MNSRRSRRSQPNDSTPYELSAEHKRVLTSNRIFLVEKMQPYSLLQPLIQRRVLSQDDKDLVQGGPRDEAVRNLLQMIARRGANALVDFVESLEETGQLEVADKLRVDAPDLPLRNWRRLQETCYEPLPADLTYTQAMEVLNFHPKRQEVRPGPSIPTMIINFVSYDPRTRRRPLTENRQLCNQLSEALSANRSFEVLPTLEDWSVSELEDCVHFFASNCYNAGGALTVVFGHASHDLQSVITCDNELLPIKTALLDPIESAPALADKLKLFIFCFEIEGAVGSSMKFTYGFASDEVKIFSPRPGDHSFVRDLSSLLSSLQKDPLTDVEAFCQKRCEHL